MRKGDIAKINKLKDFLEMTWNIINHFTIKHYWKPTRKPGSGLLLPLTRLMLVSLCHLTFIHYMRVGNGEGVERIEGRGREITST